MTVGMQWMPKLFAECLDLTQRILLPLSNLLLEKFQAILFWMMSSAKELNSTFCSVTIQKRTIVPPLKELVLYAALMLNWLVEVTRKKEMCFWTEVQFGKNIVFHMIFLPLDLSLVMTVGTRWMPKLFAECLDLTQRILLPPNNLLLEKFQAILFWMTSSAMEMNTTFWNVPIQKRTIVTPVRELVLFANLLVN